MYVLKDALSKYTLILTLNYISRENGDSKQANIHQFSCAIFTSLDLFKS